MAILSSTAIAMLFGPNGPRVLVAYNASGSAPRGFYLVGRPGSDLGDLVLTRLPEPARTLAARRQYLPYNVPALKRVAARQGERVCAVGRSITINARLIAYRSRRDRRGRILPWWSGCRTISKGEIFLLNPAAQSFDGRYFGVTRAKDVIGRAVAL